MSEPQEELKIFKSEVLESLANWQRLRQINRNWDGALTIATILLTLITTIIGIDGISLEDGTRKLWIGVCGGLVVAIQSIGNAFPVKQRAGGYRLLQGQGYELRSRIAYLQSDTEITETLPKLQEQYYKLLDEASKLEA